MDWGLGIIGGNLFCVDVDTMRITGRQSLFPGEWLWAGYLEAIYPWADGRMECGSSHILRLILMFWAVKVSSSWEFLSLPHLVHRLYIFSLLSSSCLDLGRSFCHSPSRHGDAIFLVFLFRLEGMLDAGTGMSVWDITFFCFHVT